MQGNRGAHIGHTQAHQFLLKGVLVLPPRCLLLGRWQGRIRTGIRSCSLIEGCESSEPLPQGAILRIVGCEVMAIAHHMHPAALMPSLVDSVGGEEVAAWHSLEGLTQELRDHFAAAGVMVLAGAHTRSTRTPDVAIAAIFSPADESGWHCQPGCPSRDTPHGP